MPDRPQREPWGHPPFGDGDLDAWLAGNTTVTPPAVDDALSALLAPPSSAELASEHRALAEFRRARRRRSSSPMLFASAAALIIVVVCGAAAVTGRLPTPIQNIAHVFAGHDSPTSGPTRSADPVSSLSGIVPSRQPSRSDAPPGSGFRSTVPFSRPRPPSSPRGHDGWGYQSTFGGPGYSGPGSGIGFNGSWNPGSGWGPGSGSDGPGSGGPGGTGSDGPGSGYGGYRGSGGPGGGAGYGGPSGSGRR
jgi:hypothetical protein